MVVGLEAPKLKLIISICFSKPLRVDSPSIPSILRNASNAMEASCRDGRVGEGVASAGGLGRSATRRIETLSSSSWKCGRRKATAR